MSLATEEKEEEEEEEEEEAERVHLATSTLNSSPAAPSVKL